MFVSIHVVVLVLAACEEDGCWFREMVGLQKCTLHSEDRFGVHCIAIIAGIQGIPIWPIGLIIMRHLAGLLS